jgi:LPS export ABC transporter protein LptC
MLSKNKFRLLLAAAIMAAAVALAMVAYRQLSGRKAPAPVAQSSSSSVDLAMKGATFTETFKDNTKWNLNAENAEYDNSNGTVNLRRVRMLVASTDKGVGEVTLTADKALYDTATKDVALSGAVNASSTTGMKFSTERVRLQAAQKILTSDDPVAFSKGTLSVKGKGMEYRLLNGNLRLKTSVDASFAGEKTR